MWVHFTIGNENTYMNHKETIFKLDLMFSVCILILMKALFQKGFPGVFKISRCVIFTTASVSRGRICGSFRTDVPDKHCSGYTRIRRKFVASEYTEFHPWYIQLSDTTIYSHIPLTYCWMNLSIPCFWSRYGYYAISLNPIDIWSRKLQLEPKPSEWKSKDFIAIGVGQLSGVD